MKLRALEAVLATQWAIMPETLELIASIASREHEYAGNVEALEAKLGRPLGNTMTASVRGGVASIPIEGPLFRRANLMTQFSGATSYEVAARDLTAALEDPSVRAVMLQIDSPGGEVSGTSELAAMIRSASKPVWAHISGTGASAAYWLASAADKIIAADTAVIGSIGVQVGYRARDAQPGERSVRFVSTQSPLKNADPETEAGAAGVQAMVDDLAAVFVSAVAAGRNVTVDTVLAQFGRGGVMVAEKAAINGMIDSIGTFEGALSALQKELDSMDYSALTVAGLTENRADLVAAIRSEALASVEKVDAEAIRAEGAAAERARIVAIEALAVPGTDALIAGFKADGTEPAAAAMKIVQAVQAQSKAAGSSALDNIKKAENEMVPPAPIKAAGEDSVDPVEALLATGRATGAIR